MPKYDFTCECGLSKTVQMSATQNISIICECGKEMKRTFQVAPKNITYGDPLQQKKIGTSKVYRELKETKKRFECLKKDLKRGDYK